MRKKIDMKNYIYNYKIIIENKKIDTVSITERNYIKTFENNNKIIKDIPNNLFKIYNCLKKLYIIKMNIFIKKLIKDIKQSSFLYDIEINYIYCKTRLNKKIISRSNNFYELNIYCYDEKRKIGFSKKIKEKSLRYSKLKKEIFNYEKILKKEIKLEDGIIDSKEIIIKRNALSQIMSLYKKNIWQERELINNKNKIKIYANSKKSFNTNFYNKYGNKNKNQTLNIKTSLNDIISNQSFSFKNKNIVKDIEKKLNNGYVITNVYFLNNNKENKNIIKLLCTGYYLENEKIKFIFSNRILTINIFSIINGIKYVSKKRTFSNEFNCPDILTKI